MPKHKEKISSNTLINIIPDVNKFKKASDVPEADAEGESGDAAEVTEATESTSAATARSETNGEDVQMTEQTASY